MFVKQSFFALALLTLGSMASDQHTSACQDNWRQIRKRLRASQTKWAKKAPSTSCYNMTLAKQCFCTPEWIGPHALQITNGAIKNTTIPSTEMPTVEDLFDLVDEHCVADCPASGAASCKVRFDPVYGYIKSLWIDVSAQMADEEIGYVVSDLSFCES